MITKWRGERERKGLKVKEQRFSIILVLNDFHWYLTPSSRCGLIMFNHTYCNTIDPNQRRIYNVRKDGAYSTLSCFKSNVSFALSLSFCCWTRSVLSLTSCLASRTRSARNTCWYGMESLPRKTRSLSPWRQNKVHDHKCTYRLTCVWHEHEKHGAYTTVEHVNMVYGHGHTIYIQENTLH